MLDTYRAVLRAPGAARFCSAAFVMRLPLSMYPVGLVLLVSLREHDYAFGSYLEAVYTVGAIIGGPVLSRVADRGGQKNVIVTWTVVHTVAVVALIVASSTGAPRLVLLPVCLVIGFSYLSVGSLVRARWAELLEGTPELGTAFSLESILDEAIFVVGPVLASVLATTVDPVAPFVVVLVLTVVGAAGLATAPYGEAHPHAATTARPPMPRAPLALLLLALVFVGMMLAAMDLATVAFVGQQGHAAWSGAVLACAALGSGVAGIVYGARHHRRPLAQRMAVQAVVFGVLPLLLWATTGPIVLAPLLFVVGLGVAPMLIVGFAAAEEVTPPQRRTEAMAWVNTGLAVGVGIITPVVGLVADHAGGYRALQLPWPAGVVAAGFTVLAAAAVARHAAARRPGAVTPACDDGGRAALP